MLAVILVKSELINSGQFNGIKGEDAHLETELRGWATEFQTEAKPQYKLAGLILVSAIGKPFVVRDGRAYCVADCLPVVTRRWRTLSQRGRNTSVLAQVDDWVCENLGGC